MRIVLFTVEDLEFVPELIEPLIQHYGEQIVACYVSKSMFNVRFLKKRFWFFVRNLYPFCIRVDDWLRLAVKTVRFRRQGYSFENTVEYLREKGLNAQYIEEIRTGKTRRMLRSLKPDLFLFCPFDKIAGSKFIGIPRRGTYNLHLGKLPEHRGGLSAFWALRLGDKSAGATLHRVVPEIDEGAIVDEVRFPVQTNSMEGLMHVTVREASRMVVRGVERIAAQEFSSVDTTGRSVGYHLLPGTKDFVAFYKRGCRLI